MIQTIKGIVSQLEPENDSRGQLKEICDILTHIKT